MQLMKKILPVIFMILSCSPDLNSFTGIYIRLNQVEYLPDEAKVGVILSQREIGGVEFKILSNNKKEVVHSGTIKFSHGTYGNFNYTYQVDFSILNKPGNYYFEIAGNSEKFSIGNTKYSKVTESLMKFFKVQRCGFTEPEMHDICHQADITSIINGSETINRSVDLTGGWHDAGDYTKFLNTTAYTVYTLLFAYEFDPVKFGFDLDGNNVPDVLDEAKIGLDWLLRCNYEKFKLITQVQDLRDHQVGWRMPEDDPLAFDRPGFTGMGKNIIGIYSAAMAIASRIWREKLQFEEFADACLNSAENLLSITNEAADIDSNGTGAYLDKTFHGKLALANIEMYLTTNRPNFLEEAVKHADAAGADYWWSYGDMSSYAHYKLAKIENRFSDYLKESLEHYKNSYESNVFGQPIEFGWGSNITLLGVTLKNILYKNLTGDITYDTLALSQRDYILGKNPWGVSFISGFGNNYPRNYHHQISAIKKKVLPGGFAAGPSKKEIIEKFNIPYSSQDIFEQFQTEQAYYRDDYNDYITNEPTIVGNATAVLVMGYFSKGE